MSDDDRDIDVESDEGDDSDSSRQPTPSPRGSSSSNSMYYSQAEKRAHHNALERKRRDHIKDSFTGLRDSVPMLQGEKVASRAQILKKAAEYIKIMTQKNNAILGDIANLKRQNNLLDAQIRELEKEDSARSSDGREDFYPDNSESDLSDEEFVQPPKRRKVKLVSSSQ